MSSGLSDSASSLAGASSARSYGPGRVALFVAIALLGAGFDLGTKTYVFGWLGEPGMVRPHTVVRDLIELQTSYNTGALWGFAKDVPHSSLMFAILSIAAALGICVWLFRFGAARDLGYTLALSLITAGALGNCYDRLVFGKVRDFVHLHIDAIRFDCAIFNFADNMLVLGAVGLILLALRPEPGGDDRIEVARSAASA